MKAGCVFILMLSIVYKVNACSVFYATDANKILAGKNTDWKIPDLQLLFVPAKDGSYGYMVHNIRYFISYFSSDGGINDQGLFFECADNLFPRDLGFHPEGTINFDGNTLVKILTSCNNVDDVIEFFKKWNDAGLSGSHILFGDRFGKSVIIERADNISLAFIRSDKNYQVATNFLNSYMSDPVLARFTGCYRYTYIDDMLKSNKELSVDLFRTILDGAANKGQETPTISSFIYDLTNLDLYAYVNNNYDELLKFNLNDELKTNWHSIYLQDYFSGIKGTYPVSDQVISGSSADFSWVGDDDDYEISVSTSKDFTEASVVRPGEVNYQKAGFSVLTLLVLLLSALSVWTNKKLLIAGVFILALVVGCEKDSKIFPQAVSSVKHSKQIDGLMPGKTYYWKILTSGTNKFKSESIVYTFKTSDF
jgi:hypothetical protein